VAQKCVTSEYNKLVIPKEDKMSTEEIVHEAGQKLATVTFDYTEADGSNEGTREVEPYSYRNKNGQRLFFGFDTHKGAIRSFVPSSIRNIALTSNTFTPRWPVEV